MTREHAQKVLDAMPTSEWRLIFALSRFGGLRCPSETLSLTWDHVQWTEGRLIIPSPKTEHHEGKEARVIPIFPELRPYLEETYREHQEGPIIRADRDHKNLSVKFKKILKRKGLEAWPKIFHNLRASRETELAEEYPIQVVCSWIGNSPKVAMRHYLQVTESQFEKALKSVQISVQSMTE